MKTLHVTETLPDGNKIIIRVAKPEDASQLLQLKLGYIKNTTTIPLFEDEYTNDEQQETTLIEKYINEPNSILLVAEYENQLLGNIDLTGSQRRKLYHTGMIGMGIAYSWQNKGVGHLLLKNVIKWADECSAITILWLEVYSENKAGIKLYEKNGFAYCGEIKNFFGADNKITMVKHLKS